MWQFLMKLRLLVLKQYIDFSWVASFFILDVNVELMDGIKLIGIPKWFFKNFPSITPQPEGDVVQRSVFFFAAVRIDVLEK